jgi:hypothetical protein
MLVVRSSKDRQRKPKTKSTPGQGDKGDRGGAEDSLMLAARRH